MFMGPRNWFQGMNSASLCSLAGRYKNPIPPQCLVPIDFLKIPAQVYAALSSVSFRGIPFTQNIYCSFPADSPRSRKEAPRWRVLYRITRQLLHHARCGSFSQKMETASWAQPANPKCFILLCRISCELAGCVHQPIVHDSQLRPNKP